MILHRTTIAGLLKALDCDLSNRQLAVLGSIASGRGAMVSREVIYADVWGKQRRPEHAHSIVSIAVCALRKKGFAISGRYGWGYRP